MKYSATKDDRTTAVLGRVAEQVPAYGVLSSVGQVGYSYLENTETVLTILDEAIQLNESQSEVLNKIKSKF
mgnify:CR=1 FL=1